MTPCFLLPLDLRSTGLKKYLQDYEHLPLLDQPIFQYSIESGLQRLSIASSRASEEANTFPEYQPYKSVYLYIKSNLKMKIMIA